MAEAITDWIQQLAQSGKHQSSGAFSVDLSQLQLRFAHGCDDCLDYWLRFALYYGAPALRLSWRQRRLELEFEASGPDLEELRCLLLHPQLGARYLGMGVVAALHQGYEQVVFESERARASFDGSGQRIDTTRRLRQPLCRLTAEHSSPLRKLRLPDFSRAGIPIWVQERRWSGSGPSYPGLTLILHGAALPWSGPPLIPSDCCLEYPVERARLDVMLARLQQPALDVEQIQELQRKLEEELLARPQRSLAQLEWLMVRLFAQQRWDECWQLLQLQPRPQPGQCFAAAYFERVAWLQRKYQGRSQPDLAGLLVLAWGADLHWPEVVDSGSFPELEEEWLRATYRLFRGSLAVCAYRHLLRLSWGEEVQADFLQALFSFRRDTLGGNYLLAGLLLGLRPGQLPRAGTEFCAQLLTAACRGKEATSEWSLLNDSERSRVLSRTLQLCRHSGLNALAQGLSEGS